MTETVWPWPNYPCPWGWATQPITQGCICPPKSEKTCENPLCPRKDPFRKMDV